jgi:hypothetical protein
MSYLFLFCCLALPGRVVCRIHADHKVYEFRPLWLLLTLDLVSWACERLAARKPTPPLGVPPANPDAYAARLNGEAPPATGQ